MAWRPRCACPASRARRSSISSRPRLRAIDVGFLGNRPFFNIAGIGLDAQIATEFNRRTRGRRGKWPYVTIGVARRPALSRARLRARLRRPAQHGHRADHRIRQRRRVRHGRVPLAGRRARRRAARSDGRRGSIGAGAVRRCAASGPAHDRARAEGPHRARVRRGSVSRPAGPMLYHVDGEPGIATEALAFRLEPGALRVKA